MTDEGRQALNIVEKALTAQTSSHCDYTEEWGLYILPSKLTPTAVLFQDPPLYWIHLPVSPAQVLTPYFGLVSNLVAKGCRDSRELLGRDPYFICLPFTEEQQDWLFQFSGSWNAALAHFAGRLENHFPANELLHFASQHDFVFSSVVVLQSPYSPMDPQTGRLLMLLMIMLPPGLQAVPPHKK